MNGAIAVIKKEWRSYFYSPIAYVILGIFLFVMGTIFAKFVAIYQQYQMQSQFGGGQSVTLDKVALYLYQNMAFILCFVTPFITMRLFAEEKRQNTFELLFTAPVKVVELVLGKFFAAYGLMLLMVALSFVYVFFMVLWGTPDLGIIGTTYLGLMMSLACYVAVGTAISAVTNSQAIAAVFTFIALLMLWLLQSLGQGVTTTFLGIDIGQTLQYISPLKHFSNFSEGIIYVKDVVYFLSFTIFMLFLTQRIVESHRWR